MFEYYPEMPVVGTPVDALFACDVSLLPSAGRSGAPRTWHRFVTVEGADGQSAVSVYLYLSVSGGRLPFFVARLSVSCAVG
jgi:hypothetical protein